MEVFRLTEPQGYGEMIKIKESQLAALQAELKEIESVSPDDCSHLEVLETAWKHHQALM
jgi:hypothetical protein